MGFLLINIFLMIYGLAKTVYSDTTKSLWQPLSAADATASINIHDDILVFVVLWLTPQHCTGDAPSLFVTAKD